MFTPCCNPIAARNLRGVGVKPISGGGMCCVPVESGGEFGAATGAMVEGATSAAHQLGRHLGNSVIRSERMNIRYVISAVIVTLVITIAPVRAQQPSTTEQV